jgi:hypothetical protein
MGKLSKILIDTDRSAEGVDFPYDEGIVWKVARWGNPAFQQDLTNRLAKLSKRDQRGEVGDDAVKISFGRYCLLGWDDLEDENGRPIPYSAERSVAMCRDAAFDPVLNELMIFSKNVDNYRAESIEDAAGNSSSCSSGSSDGASTSGD